MLKSVHLASNNLGAEASVTKPDEPHCFLEVCPQKVTFPYATHPRKRSEIIMISVRDSAEFGVGETWNATLRPQNCVTSWTSGRFGPTHPPTLVEAKNVQPQREMSSFSVKFELETCFVENPIIAFDHLVRKVKLATLKVWRKSKKCKVFREKQKSDLCFPVRSLGFGFVRKMEKHWGADFKNMLILC